MSNSICIGRENIDNPEFNATLKTISEDGTLTDFAVVTQLTNSKAKLVKKALKQNPSIRRICCQHRGSSICDLSFLKLLNQQSQITELKISTENWYTDLSTYLKNNRSLTAIDLTFGEKLDGKAKDQFSGELMRAIGSIGMLEKFRLECRKLTHWDLNGFVDLVNGNKNLREISITLTDCQLLNVNGAVKALAEVPSLTTFRFVANGSNSLDGAPLLESLKGNKNITLVEIQENWLNDRPELVQCLAGLPSLETLCLLPGETLFKGDISPLFVPSSPLKRLEMSPLNFVSDNLLKLLPETEVNTVRFYVPWEKAERIPTVGQFCEAAKFNYYLSIRQKYNDRCGIDPAKLSIIRATLLREALMALSGVFVAIQTLVRPAHRGDLQILPNELLVQILHQLTHSAIYSYPIEIDHLAKLIEFAKNRELMQGKDRRKVIGEIWRALELPRNY